ncbi:cupredoxin domain-containing protein [Kitasatospora sp. NPDC051853]|uniref:cupredoxin domain-containing protein n=1 Tax=Kitasatospora sp. NPDC051853 TaxID=3364058 RepID=UPI0037953A2C
MIIRDGAFAPAELTVAPGARITVTNQDSIAHTLTATGSGGFDTGLLSKGQSKTITAPSAPGSYPFICIPHAITMKGTLTVA